MIYKVRVDNDYIPGYEMILTDPVKSKGIYVVSITGIGPEKADVNISTSANSDNGWFNSARMQTRNIVLQLGFIEYPTVEDVRHLTYMVFPLKKQVTLTFYTDNHNVSISGIVEMNQPDIFSEKEGTQISILCPFPYFKDADTEEEIYYDGSVVPMFEFPFHNDLITVKQWNEAGGSMNSIYLWDSSLKDMSLNADGKTEGTLLSYWNNKSVGMRMGVYYQSSPVMQLYDGEYIETGYNHFNQVGIPVIYEGTAETGFVMEIEFHRSIKMVEVKDYGNRDPIVEDDEDFSDTESHFLVAKNAFKYVHTDLWPYPTMGYIIIQNSKYPNESIIIDLDKISVVLPLGRQVYKGFEPSRTANTENGIQVASIVPQVKDIAPLFPPVAQMGDRMVIDTQNKKITYIKPDYEMMWDSKNYKGIWEGIEYITHSEIGPGGGVSSMSANTVSYKGEEFNILGAVNSDRSWLKLDKGVNMISIYHTFDPTNPTKIPEYEETDHLGNENRCHIDFLDITISSGIYYEGV